MTKLFLLGLGTMICLLSSNVMAAPLLSPTPLCSIIKNQSERTVFIAVRTNYFEGADGTKQRHEASLRLNPTEKQQVCADTRVRIEHAVGQPDDGVQVALGQ